MKKLKTLLFASSLLVGFSSVTMAQSTDNATISANANVVQDMVVGNEFEDLEFNNILVNSAKFIDATDGSVDASATGTGAAADGITDGETRGYFSIEIISGTNVDVTLDVPSNLEDGSSNTLQIGFGETGIGDETDNLNGLLTETEPTGTASVTAITGGAGSNFTLTTGEWDLDSAFEMPSGGKVYLALGGEVSASSTQTLGSYTGDITLTATVAD
ncbi:hypothetical protein [Gracilimonas halophila]|uniref:DUF4402 domain-containing protein n=1 Tax=Gracilimonas halophila TaxID=1834464 RepID=A0ABW5JJJ8_9BACT